MTKPTSEKDNQIIAVQLRLDAIIAILLRQTNDEGIAKWKKLDRPNMTKLLIDLGFSNNDEIARILDVAYGSVANIRSKHKSKGKKK
jgi:hypothetical protein